MKCPANEYICYLMNIILSLFINYEKVFRAKIIYSLCKMYMEYQKHDNGRRLLRKNKKARQLKQIREKQRWILLEI